MRTFQRGATVFAAFSAAVFLAIYLLPTGLWVPLGLACLVPAGLLLWQSRTRGALICLGVAAALVWCGCFRAVFFAPAEGLDDRRCQVTVVLNRLPTATPYGALAPCWVLQEGDLPVQGTLYAGAELQALRPGDRVTATCDCAQTALREETRFSTNATYGVFVTLKARGELEVERAERTPWWCLPQRWSEAMGRAIQAAVPGPAGGLLTALVTGDKAGLSDPVRSDLSRSGIAHLVAVSGMHVCFLVSLLTLFTGFKPKGRFAVCVPVLCFFALAVGATPSVLRACLFQVAFLLADLLGREEDRWTTLFGALALLLLLDPFSAANIGLQMSFGAVAGITLVSNRAYDRLKRLTFRGHGVWTGRVNRLLERGWQLISASLGAMLFTVPLGAYYFGTFSLLALLTNLLVLPVAAGLFAGGLLIGLLGMLAPALAALPGWLFGWLGSYVLWVSGTLAGFPYCSLSLSEPAYLAAFLVMCPLGLGLVFWRGGRRWRRVMALCAAAALVAAVGWVRWDFVRPGMALTVLDVGQGQSVVLACGGEVAVVDCGGSRKDNAGNLCADYLNNRGEGVVDKLILTHYHADHANGLELLFHRLKIREVVAPAMEHDEETQLSLLALAKEEGSTVTWLEEDLDLPLGTATLRLYAPLGDGGANEEGASVRLSSPDFSALITGDMNAAVEEALVGHAGLDHCDVLVAGHHGSRYATSQTLLDAITPKTAVISVGENHYGHPSPETLDRLGAHGVEVYRTDTQGAVTLRSP